jgi:predicted peptidase
VERQLDQKGISFQITKMLAKKPATVLKKMIKRYGITDQLRLASMMVTLVIAGFGCCAVCAQAPADAHAGQYNKNLTYKGPVTGNEITYTLYLPPEYDADKGPYPLIIFLHGVHQFSQQGIHKL